MKSMLLTATTFSMLAAAQNWQLEEPTVVPSATRDYRFTIENDFANVQGQIPRKEEVTAQYRLTMPSATGIWREASIRTDSGAVTRLPYLEGVVSGIPNSAEILKPEFFKNFPPQAFEARNLVWDSVMLLSFAKTPFRFLKLNEPFLLLRDQQLDLAGGASFNNKNVVLTWSGYSQQNRQRCALIDYHAFFNPLSIDQSGMQLKGRSHYWGQMWISMATRQIEYATLNEDVLLEQTIAGQAAPQLTNVFRIGVFEPAEHR